MTRLFLLVTAMTLLGTSTRARAQPALQPLETPLQLTADERELLASGEISDGTATAGKVTSILFGLGVGQAVEGRWTKIGWVYTLGDVASAGLIATATIQGLTPGCSGSCGRTAAALFIGGGLVGLASRIGQIYDAFTAPGNHNRRVRELRMRVGMQPTAQVLPYVAPTDDGNGASAGVTVRW